MKIAYLGPEGTYTHAATEKIVEDNQLTGVTLIPVDGITKLLNDLNTGLFDAAVAPLKNTIAGPYTETEAGIDTHGLVRVAETFLKIELAIGIHPQSSADQITQVWSKDTALIECSQYLSKRFPTATQVQVESTGYAMKTIADQVLLHVAAVGSAIGMRRYGLKQLAKGIENPGKNITTFLFLKRQK